MNTQTAAGMRHNTPLVTLGCVLAPFALGPFVLGCSPSNPGAEVSSLDGISDDTTSEPSDDTTTSSADTTSTTDPLDTTTDDSSSSGDTEPDPADEDGDDDDEGGGPTLKFDLAAVPDSPPYDESCGMVDFLFVIDNSGSMGDEQINLINNFPAFINGIEATLDTVDSIHVAVTTTDDYWANVVGCQSIGSAVVQTGGSSSSNSLCGPYAEGANYMTEMDDLGTTFACAAQVGVQGSGDERPMQAMINAVNGEYGDPDECNEGFIRDEALLVVIIITDEPDNNSFGGPMTWYDAVVDAKLGIPENVVVVSLINTPGGNCGFDQAQSIATFTTMFGMNGFMADICVPNFAPVFDQAVEIIDVACENALTP
ncbi:hypothetical protein [Enhygromyxa salina]|uniref:VWFA domain-containing protein n=1 Tax=Enhygromyxa salina TaxID=215803 RepID=A0A2S9YR89_9BACT|nr:hypothetical protein [Enhygromyxa salina]PRQ07579.1 hypothetical protein ENSA7_25690 [Enhygromyxa salina]